MEKGTISKVVGPVVDVRFPEGEMPAIYDAVYLEGCQGSVTAEVVQELGGSTVRCIALSSTDGLSRGCQVTASGGPIKMPVGEETLGRMFNVVGQAIDGKGPVDAKEFKPIHQNAPNFTDIVPAENMLETGIKVVDLLTPYAKGGKIGLFGGAGVGKTVLIM